MRGEDAAIANENIIVVGSPPHARGRPNSTSKAHTRLRITPACAGKTDDDIRHAYRGGDHPRMRGEDRGFYFDDFANDGSPPHARGRLHRFHPYKLSFRITPACAGKTQSPGITDIDNPDHPRMRGEDFASHKWTATKPGSPPHARGRLRDGGGVGGSGWITPACAGKTITRFVNGGTPPDHPRMRGEDPFPGRGTMPRNGSPPHARGRRSYHFQLLLNRRITPACAGKTQ